MNEQAKTMLLYRSMQRHTEQHPSIKWNHALFSYSGRLTTAVFSFRNNLTVPSILAHCDSSDTTSQCNMPKHSTCPNQITAAEEVKLCCSFWQKYLPGQGSQKLTTKYYCPENVVLDVNSESYSNSWVAMQVIHDTPEHIYENGTVNQVSTD